MHDVLTRQLIAPTIALSFALASAIAHADERATLDAAAQDRAATLLQTAIAAGGGTLEERQKLDKKLAELVAENPRNATIHDARAEFFWETGEQARAMAEWETAEQLDPKNPTVLEHLGASALALGEARKASAYYSRSLASDPTNARGHFALANIWFLFRHELIDATHPDAESLLQGSLAHFAEAARLSPSDADFARAYAETFYSISKPDWGAALIAWENFRQVSAKQDFAFLQLARVHLKLGHSDAARSCLSKIQSADYQTLKTRLEVQADATTAPPPEGVNLQP